MKLIMLFKRKPGTTFEHFRNYYENNHAPLAVRLMPYFKSYKRNFIQHDQDYKPAGGVALGAAVDYDVVTELTFASKGDYDKMLKALTNPDIRGQIVADEEKFMDRSPGGRLMFVVDETETPHAKLTEFA